MGGVSRAIAATALCPLTLVKTRMEYGGPGNVVYKVCILCRLGRKVTFFR